MPWGRIQEDTISDSEKETGFLVFCLFVRFLFQKGQKEAPVTGEKIPDFHNTKVNISHRKPQHGRKGKSQSDCIQDSQNVPLRTGL